MIIRRSRLAPIVLTATVLTTVLVPLMAAPASAAVAVAAPNPATIAAAPDYATERFADGWDYENAEDQRLDSKAGMLNVTNQRLEGGRLKFTAQQSATFDPVLTWPGDIAWGRDGALHPIDTGRYDRISFAMKSPVAAAGGVFWFNCDTRTPSCQGATAFSVQPGWRVYDIPLQNTIAQLAWSGPMTSLRITPNVPAGTALEFDWIRLHHRDAPVTINWTDDSPGNQVSLNWDRDNNLSNNSADSPDWGVVETKQSGPSNSTTFQASAFPPGVYRFFADDAGTPSAYSEPLTIDARPQPVVTNPDAAGGTDYASAVRGDAWDFDQASDAGTANAQNVTFANSAINGTNGPPNQNDPQVLLPLGPAPVDASRFHRLSFSYSYGGAFGLEDAPGGGTMSRIIWEVLGGGPNNYQDLNDLVTYQGPNNVVVDLAGLPLGTLIDEEQQGARIGWMGQQITSLRFDPNEDPGARTWSVADIRLAEDDAAGPEGFDITFRDNAWEEGTTAEIFVDTDAGGFNGTRVGEMNVVNGINTFRWVPQVGGGLYFPYVVLNDGSATAGAYASGPVSVRTVGRIAGADRIATAISIGDNSFAPGSAQVAVLARHDNFPDALAGTPLAAEKGGPLLLTQPGGLDSRVGEALDRMVPDGRTVYLLGGPGALGPAVEQAVAARGYNVVRLFGNDRYETSVAIAEEVGNPHDILLTTGTNFPDALSAGAAAGALTTPAVVVLSNGEALPPSTSAYISGNPQAQVWAVGGQAAAAAPAGAQALVGANRYETSARVAERFFPSPTFVGIASGVNFPDALAGGAHAARRGSPLLLSPPDGLPGPVVSYLQARRDPITAGVLYGGSVALSENVRTGVEQAIG
ncbi:MAG TPA: cell wall-binding repeat-containing protein [Acidimicrobiales bacterium]|nr:cell wall-binding repeat-containing protein [Acidimicrobiales bacterium]